MVDIKRSDVGRKVQLRNGDVFKIGSFGNMCSRPVFIETRPNRGFYVDVKVVLHQQ